MKQEIERKFLLGKLPKDLDRSSGKEILQAYLCCEASREVRIRKKPGSFELTVKTGSGVVRSEVNVAISETDFAQLWQLTEGRRLEKIRYHYMYDGNEYEIDSYKGTLNPLLVAELEFSDEQQAINFVPPDFLGQEISEHAAYKNSSLALAGMPEVS